MEESIDKNYCCFYVRYVGITSLLDLVFRPQVEQRIFLISFSDLVTLWVLDTLLISPLLIEKLRKIGEILVRS